MNGDGTKDLIVGCFQGFPHYLEATGGGNYQKEAWLKDSAGSDIHTGNFWGIKENKWMYVKQVEGVGDNNILLYPKMVDWDNDGDLDLVSGGSGGNIGLRINNGTAAEPAFAKTQDFVKASGGPISLKSQVSIEIADLDGDGLFDIICATTDGTVLWYRNSGTKESPAFTDSKTISASFPGGPKHYLCVTALDYNGDGKSDLLVGAEDKDYKGGYWVYSQK